MIKRAFFLVIQVSLFFSMNSCSNNKIPTHTPEKFLFTQENVSHHFSIQSFKEGLSVVYAQYDSASLYEISIDNTLSTTQNVVDTIDTVPPINPLFGIHAALSNGKYKILLYQDQQTEENLILKLNYTPENGKNVFTDVLTPVGIPIAIIRGKKNPIAVWQNNDNIYYAQISLTNKIKPKKIRQKFNLKTVYPTENERCFFAFDRLSKSIYKFSLKEEKKEDNWDIIYQKILPLKTSIYYIETNGNNKYTILFYDKDTETIKLLDKYPNAAPPLNVTLSKGTTSLYMTRYDDSTIFLFNELTLDSNKKKKFAISAIYSAIPKSGEKTQYRKSHIITTNKPIKFKCLQQSNNLFIAYEKNGSLSLILIDLDKLIRKGS